MPTWGLAPPPQYDRRYDGPVIVQVLTIGQIKAICGDWADACSWLDGGECHIVLPQGGIALGFIRRHEEAHCRGWPSNHPGGILVQLD
jgi:hypothetical protein